jgi:outer membrane protein OmpA-like peptidoglycan-associated protein
MMIYGSGNLPPLAVDLSGLSPKSMIGWAIEVGGSFGRIGDLQSISGGYKMEDALHVKVNDDYTVDSGLEEKAHFRLGSALLNPEAWQIIRVVSAKELTALMSSGTRLEIVGHADRRDTEERNVELTELRARNTLQAIRDILGKQFGVQDEHIALVGMGEKEAINAGDRDERANPEWRKVEVILNSRLVVTLRGE